MGDEYSFSDYYFKGEKHVLRVLYGERHITVEVIHSILDGRGLAEVVQALLAQYFELLGIGFDKKDIISCADEIQAENGKMPILASTTPPGKSPHV